MSANGEKFISGLREIATEKGLLKDSEDLITPDWAYECWDNKDLMELGEVTIENDEGDIEGKLSYKVHFYAEPDGYGGIDLEYREEWIKRGNVKVFCLPTKDYIEYLEPIISDFKDGSGEALTNEDVDFLIGILKAKISFSEGLITQEEYDRQMNSTEV